MGRRQRTDSGGEKYISVCFIRVTELVFGLKQYKIIL
jgi:hypothetical protein